MSKTKEQLLEQFTRANQPYKLKILQRAGKTREEYIKWLREGDPKKIEDAEKTVKKGSKKETKKLINIVDILDASGSMAGGKYEKAKEGILAGIELLKKDGSVQYTYSLIEFVQSGEVITHYLLNDLPSGVSFHGATGGNTPLYKTVYDTINTIKEKVGVNDKVLLRVSTDRLFKAVPTLSNKAA